MTDSQSAAVAGNSHEMGRQRTMLDFALLYAKEGLRVPPLQFLRSPGCCSCGSASCHSIAKHPLTWNGVKDATSSSQQISHWWQQQPNANIGIATGKGLLVIDIDPKNGGSLEALNAVVALPPTSTLCTGGGGLHLYFSCDRRLIVRNSVSKLAPGIDIRGENGYVVAPPSIHASGHRYRWEHRNGYTPAPDALLSLLMEKAPPLLLYNDTPDIHISNQEKTKQEVANSGRFIPEGKRNSTLVSLAGSLRNQGANEEIMGIVLQAVNKGGCQPPLSDAEVRQICKSAANWTPGVNGNILTTRPMVVKKVAALMAEELPSPAWSIPTLLPEGVTLLAGKPKMGKSWLALGLAVSVAQGYKALGKLPTNQGTVLYLGLEDNEQRICSRMTRLLQDDPPPAALFWSGTCAPLTLGGLSELEAWIAAAHPRLVVIDTLARVRAHTGNSSGSVYADDYAAIVPLKQLAEQYHLSILLIHHLRKSMANDPMDEVSGSTGLTGATDCNMVLQRERGQKNAALHITGRDVEDQVLALTFDMSAGLWSLIDPSSALNLSVVRESILALLAQKQQGLSPSEIAEALNLDQSSVRKKLSLMKKAGQVFSTNRGLYHLAKEATIE